MKLRILFIALLFSTYSWAQFNVAAFGTNYTQDFNGLASSGSGNTWTNNTTLSGWYARTTAGTGTALAVYDTNTGSTTSGGFYSFGVAGTNVVGERALGYVNSNAFTGGSGTGKGYIGWRLKNTTGASISSITVTWTGEQWRRSTGAGASTISLFYQTGTTVTDLITGTWTTASSTFTALQTGANLQLDGNAPANKTASITATINVTIAAGDEIMLRWEDLNDVGTDHILAIDDVTVNAGGLFTAVTNGDWSTPATWDKNAVPGTGSNVLIPSPYTVYLTTGVTRNTGTTTTVDPGGTLATANVGVANTNVYVGNGTTTINGTFRLEDNSTITSPIGLSNFVYGTSAKLDFYNSIAAGKTINNIEYYWPTTATRPLTVNVLQGGINILAGGPRTVDTSLSTTNATGTVGIKTTATSKLTVPGITRINTGGLFTAVGVAYPVYATTSTLIYATGTSYPRGTEWGATGVQVIGTPGYPHHVQISGTGTILTLNSVAQRTMNGDLTIGNGATFDLTSGTNPASDLNIGGSVLVANGGTFLFPNATTAASVVVGSNFTNVGTTTLSSTPTTGGNLKLAGNFSNSASGVFTGANRGIYFSKTGTQTVSNTSATTLTFPSVLTTGTGTTVQLLNNLIIDAPTGILGNVAVNFGNAADVLDINGNSLTIGTSAVANAISGSGAFKGSTTSNLSLLGTGSIGALKFTSNLNLGFFTMNRTAASVGCVMGSGLTVNLGLVLTNGLIDLAANTMTLSSTCNNTFTASANSFVIANVTAGGILSKAITLTGFAYNFPIGDNTGTAEYTPAAVNYTSGTVDATSFLGMSVDDSKEPNFTSTTDFLTRYWSLTNTGTFTSPVYTFSGTYINTASDVTGTVGTYYKSNQWDGTDWTHGGTMIGGGTLTKTGCTLATGTNHITAGIHDQEIDVRGGGNIIANGAVTTSGLNGTAYGTKNIGTNTSNVFTIFNRGGLNLTLGTITITGANPSDFILTASPASPVTAESSTTFTIRFTPTFAGYRSAIITIPNNDGNENPYTFLVDGTGQCVVTSTNTITPSSGPVDTEITITATAGTLTSATAFFNSVSATVTLIDATHMTAIVPSGAASGQLTTTNNQGCQATNYFTVLDNAIATCEGTGTGRNKIFISEITDHGSGSHSFIELFNSTGGTVDISNYKLVVYYNGNSGTTSTIIIPGAANSGTTTLANNTAYVIGFGGVNAADAHGSFPAIQTSGISGINSNDHIRLLDQSGTWIDLWGDTALNTTFTIALKDYTYRRKNVGITAPKITWAPAEWTAFTPVDYTDVGKYDYSVGTPPSITQNLTYTATCKATTLTVAAIESYTGVGNVNTTLTFQWFAVPNASNTWSLISNGGLYSGATTNTLHISDITTLIGYQFYCQIMDAPTFCYTDSKAIKIIPGQSTTWQVGNTWSNLSPDINKAVIIDNTYDTTNGFSPSFDACSVTINSGKTVTIRANDYVNIQNDLTVTGTLDVENNGSLVMIEDAGVVTNTGTTNVKRTAAGIRGFDYVYWSSPVIGQSLNTIYSSPTPGFMFYWDPVSPNINSPISTGNWIATGGAMSPAKGYIVRGSNNYAMTATSIPSIFTGAVNNGVVQVPIGRGGNTVLSTTGSGNGVTVTNFDDNWNLVGNPYPSAINAMDFLTFNTNLQGFIYLWKHNNAPVSLPDPFYGSFLYDYNPSDYLAYNKLGAQTQSGFDGYIASGQGFFILMNDGAYDTSQTASFKNSMRSKTFANTQFYRTSSPSTTSSTEEERHRIWLDLVDSNNQSARTLVGYATEATNNLDRLYDAFKNIANTMSIHSIAEDKTLIIQGRALPFNDNDQVPIGITVKLAGTYKIAIAAVDGLFSDAGQKIYLEDKQLGIIYDLRQSPYTFDTAIGIFNDRFVLRYNGNTLSNPDLGTADNNVIVSSNHGVMNIKSSVEIIQEVTVYDILGRQLFEAKAIGSNDFSASNITISQQALIVKIKLENGIIVTRKIVL